MNIKLTVFFENPFWVGVFERYDDNCYYVGKITFGSEPKDYEVYEKIKKYFFDLRFSAGVQDTLKKHDEITVNPKRLQRLISKEIKKGIGTKSQNLLKEQYKENKKINKKESRLKHEETEREKYLLKQLKKKSRKKGH